MPKDDLLWDGMFEVVAVKKNGSGLEMELTETGRAFDQTVASATLTVFPSGATDLHKTFHIGKRIRLTIEDK